MVTRIYTKHNDTWTPLRVNADLTSGSVRVLARPSDSAVTLPELEYDVVDAVKGMLRAKTESLDIGSYKLEVEVTQGADRFTFPSKGQVILVVGDDLD